MGDAEWGWGMGVTGAPSSPTPHPYLNRLFTASQFTTFHQAVM